MKICNWQRRDGVVLWATMSVGSAGAIEPYQEYRKHAESAQNLSVLKDDLFGEAMNLYTGKTEFAVRRHGHSVDRKKRAAGAVETPLQRGKFGGAARVELWEIGLKPGELP